jgi:glycerophosphoryl diester phosphodiesterase
MPTVLTAAAAAALIASRASPAVAASNPEAGHAPSSNAAGSALSSDTNTIKTNGSNGSFDLQSHRGDRDE